MRLSGITDVFFDLDHTLWDFDRNSAMTFDKIFKLNNIQVDLESFLIHYQEINLNYWKLYRNEKINKEALRFGRLKDTFLASDCVLEDVLIHKLSEEYITYLTDNNYLFENTIEILNYLQLKYNLHIISNGFEEVQYRKLVKSNIHNYFKTIVNGESIGIKKPNPEIFNFALNKAQTSVERSVMIGDGYEADILGALGVGMDVVFFDTNNLNIDTDVKQISNLIQLKKYL